MAEKSELYVVAAVAIVAIIGIFIFVFSQGKSAASLSTTSGDFSGQAYNGLSKAIGADKPVAGGCSISGCSGSPTACSCTVPGGDTVCFCGGSGAVCTPCDNSQ